jgi:hypothetical protein
MIISVTTPVGTEIVRYGKTSMMPGAGGILDVPRFMRPVLVAAGATSDDVDDIDVRTELAAGPMQEIAYFMAGHGFSTDPDAIPTIDALRSRAVALWDQHGSPPVEFL